MYIFKKSSCILIPRKYENEEFYQNIKNKLTRLPLDQYGKPIVEEKEEEESLEPKEDIKLYFFEENERYLKVPRFFPLHWYVQCRVENMLPPPKDIEIHHKIVLKNELQERTVRYMLNFDNSIIQLVTGGGKTVIAIYVVCQRKKKTFVLVHSDYLVDQWKERFKEHSDILDKDEDNIAILSSKTFEKDLEKPIIISTVQTCTSILKRFNEQFLKCLYDARIGVFLSDEVHTTVGARQFSKASLNIPATYIYGLSATPYRYDGNGDIIRYHLGNIHTETDSQGVMDAKVSVILFDFDLNKGKTYSYLNWGGNFQNARYLTQLKKSQVFKKVCMDLLNSLKNKRNIILVNHRTEILENLYKELDFESKSLFIKNAKEEGVTGKVVFATPQKIRDGVDLPKKDCLIMTTPVSNITQLSGRVLRESEGKQTPLIIDLVDTTCLDMSRSLYSRLSFYNRRKWEVKFYLKNESGIKEISTAEVQEIIKKEED